VEDAEIRVKAIEWADGEISRLKARIAELEKALMPFADAWDGESRSSWFFTFEEMEIAHRTLKEQP